MNCKICDKSFTGLVCFQQHEASEKHKKKVKLHQDTAANGAYQETTTNNNDLLIIPCTVCDIQLTGLVNFEAHVNSLQHSNMVKKKSSGNIVLENQPESTPKEPVIAEGINHINPGSVALASFLQCEICQLQFTGPVPYQQHIVSKPHKKKSIQKELISNKLSFDTVDRDKNGFSSYWKCGICDNYFSGPIPYNDHLESKGHKKKVQNVELLKKFQSTLPAQPDSTTPVPDYITQDVKINAESSGINSEWYCEICKIQTTGPDPYRQHLFGNLHRKNIRAAEDVCSMEKMRESLSNANQSQNEVSKDEQFSSNLTNFNNGDKTNEFAKDFRISNDLILCDALKSIGVVRPEDLNIIVFYPDDEIVFDNTIKNNNYNDEIIAELNCEF